VNDQHPQLEASEPADLDQPFLGGAIPALPTVFTLGEDKNLGWVVDAGAVHGIPQPAQNGESAQFAIFPFATEPSNLRSPEQAIGQASVVQVFPGQSVVTATRFDNTPLGTKTTYKAMITSTPLPPLTVAFEGDVAALDWVRQALSTINGADAPSLLVHETTADEAEYRLLADAETGCYRIRRQADALRLAVDTPGFDEESARTVAARLEHIARWTSTARLTNPATELTPDTIRMEISRQGEDGEWAVLDSTSGLRLAYTQQDGQWFAPRFRINLLNTTEQPLFCMLLDLTESYSIYTGLLPKGGVWLEPGQDAWATVLSGRNRQKSISAYIPDELFNQGVTDLRDILKLIVSTDEADANLLEQGDLSMSAVTRSTRSLPSRRSALNRLMARVQTRNIGDPAGEEPYADWTTMEVALTVMRPVEAVTAD
jgi:hypothetical protein